MLVTRPDVSPFAWLVAVDEPGLAFVVVQPEEVLCPTPLTPEELAEVELTSEAEALILAIVVVSNTPVDITIDLLVPLVINVQLQIGKQIIRDADIELARWPLGQEIVSDRAWQMAAEHDTATTENVGANVRTCPP